MTSRYGSRKFIVCLFGMSIAVFLLWADLMSQDNALKLLMTCVAGYVAGNVGQKALAKTPEATP